MSAIRGLAANASGTRLYAVAGSTFYEIAANGVRTSYGTLVTQRDTVDMRIGLTQLVIVDGGNGYTFDLETRVFARITDPDFLGSATVAWLSNYFAFIDPGTQTFYISKFVGGVEDGASYDRLDSADAYSSPDRLVAVRADHGELWLFGEASIEIWPHTGAADFPFERNSGATIQTGCMAAHTAKVLDNSIFWLGRDERGGGMVYMARGYQAQRISTEAVEQVIQAAIEDGADVKSSVAYAYQHLGHSFYCLQIPGLTTTWCYDTNAGQWHERAELTLGEYQQHRGRHHAYCYGKHIIGGEDGLLYQYDPEANTNAGDVLVRDRVSPHYATPQLTRIGFPAFELDCTVGNGIAGQSEAKVMLRYSNDGGISWGDWRESTLGPVGATVARARFLRCGAARDRVWQVRVTDDTPFAIVGAAVRGE